MHEVNKRSRVAQVLLTLAAVVIVVAGMRAAEKILVPFLLSAFVAIICGPFLSWMRRKGVPTGVALLIVICGIMGIGLLMVTLLGASVKDFSANLPAYQARLQEEARALLTWFERMGLEISDQVLLEYFDPGAAMRLVGRTLTRLGGVLTNAFFILLTVIFMLLEASSFPTKLLAIFGPTNPTLAVFVLRFGLQSWALITPCYGGY